MFFFFSSRRRHTRFDCDWSSDVCSSDLVAANPTEGGLVTWGPYRYIRHPIYTAICLATLAGVGAHWSWKTGVCGGVVVGSLVMRIFCEERLLSARYSEHGQYVSDRKSVV